MFVEKGYLVIVEGKGAVTNELAQRIMEVLRQAADSKVARCAVVNLPEETTLHVLHGNILSPREFTSSDGTKTILTVIKDTASKAVYQKFTGKGTRAVTIPVDFGEDNDDGPPSHG